MGKVFSTLPETAPHIDLAVWQKSHAFFFQKLFLNTRTAEDKSLAKGTVTEDNPVTGEFQMSGNMAEGSAHGSCSPGTASQKSDLPIRGDPAFWDICDNTIKFFVE